MVSANSSENVPNVVRKMARWVSRSVVGAWITSCRADGFRTRGGFLRRMTSGRG